MKNSLITFVLFFIYSSGSLANSCFEFGSEIEKAEIIVSRELIHVQSKLNLVLKEELERKDWIFPTNKHLIDVSNPPRIFAERVDDVVEVSFGVDNEEYATRATVYLKVNCVTGEVDFLSKNGEPLIEISMLLTKIKPIGLICIDWPWAC